MCLTKVLCVSLPLFFSCVGYAASDTPPTKHELRMSMSDIFTVVERDDWKYDLEALLPLRFANVKIEPRTGDGFSMMLYFKLYKELLAYVRGFAKEGFTETE